MISLRHINFIRDIGPKLKKKYTEKRINIKVGLNLGIYVLSRCVLRASFEGINSWVLWLMRFSTVKGEDGGHGLGNEEQACHNGVD